MKKMQKFYLNNLNPLQKKEYIESFKGNKEKPKSYFKSVIQEVKYMMKPLPTANFLDYKQKNKKMDGTYYKRRFIDAKKTGQYTTPSQFGAKGKWIGVEVECYIDMDRLFDIAINLDYYNSESEKDYNREEFFEENDKWDVLNKVLNHNNINFVNYKEDGSLDNPDKEFAVEFTIMTLQGTPMDNLKKLCKLLDRLDAEIDNKCGLHIHLDCSDLLNENKNNKSIAMNRAFRLNNAIDFLSKMVPESRRKNDRYCRLGMSPSTTEHEHRYYAINTVALATHGTIEVRLHSGTTDFTKIKNWIELCYLISRNDALTAYTPISVDDFYHRFKSFPQDLRVYCDARIAKFNKHVETYTISSVNDEATLTMSRSDLGDLYQRLEETRNRLPNMPTPNELRGTFFDTAIMDEAMIIPEDYVFQNVTSLRSGAAIAYEQQLEDAAQDAMIFGTGNIRSIYNAATGQITFEHIDQMMANSEDETA